FSISEGLKLKGAGGAWGQTEGRDYVKNHYHQPSDEYRRDWDFKGLAEMARFGYELGLSAATQSQAIEWQPGDEFEKAHKKLARNEIDAAALFAGHPELGPVHLEPIGYPPLARQTRTSGIVVLQVSVGPNGTVENVEILKGHPLLRQAAEDGVSQWKFAPRSGEPRTCRAGARHPPTRSGQVLRPYKAAGVRHYRVQVQSGWLTITTPPSPYVFHRCCI